MKAGRKHGSFKTKSTRNMMAIKQKEITKKKSI